MAEYIEREAVCYQLAKQESIDRQPRAIRRARRIVAEFPAADVVEVVRCKDCEYSVEAWVNEKGFLICTASGMDITGDDYCSYGVKMGAEKDV